MRKRRLSSRESILQCVALGSLKVAPWLGLTNVVSALQAQQSLALKLNSVERNWTILQTTRPEEFTVAAAERSRPPRHRQRARLRYSWRGSRGCDDRDLAGRPSWTLRSGWLSLPGQPLGRTVGKLFL